MLREQLRDLSTTKLVETCARLRSGDLIDPTSAAKATLHSIACRYESLDDEIKELSRQRDKLVSAAAPNLIAVNGVGPDSAATLLTAAGDNPERLASEAAFAALCGVSTAAVTVRQTPLSTLSCSAASAGMLEPRHTLHDEQQKGIPVARSCAVSSVMSHARSIER